MMRLPRFDHLVPSTIKEACALLDKHGDQAKILAGGTDLLVACKLQNIQPSMLISLSDISELAGIGFDQGNGLTIGAGTHLNDIRYHQDIVKHYPAVSQAAAAVGARQLQFMGTLGGNLCLDTRCMYYNQSKSWRKTRAVCLKMGGEVCHVTGKGKKCFAVFSGDMAPALIALGAEVIITNGVSERTLPLSEFYTQNGLSPNCIGAGEIIKQVLLPPPSTGQSSTYLKYRIRDAIDFPLAAVGVSLTRGNGEGCTDCRIVINAVGSGPIDATDAADGVKNNPLSESVIAQAAEKAAKAAHPVANVFGASPSYRRQMIAFLTKRALASC